MDNYALLKRATLRWQARIAKRLAWEANVDSKQPEDKEMEPKCMMPLPYATYFPYPMYDPAATANSNCQARYDTWFDM